MYPVRVAMPGTVWDLLVEEGQLVAEEDEILVVRTDDGSLASVRTDLPGVLRELHVASGDRVEPGQVVALVDDI